ncbi:MAG: hypothetical protein ACE5LU_00375 [Anaerolineae bacterium]
MATTNSLARRRRPVSMSRFLSNTRVNGWLVGLLLMHFLGFLYYLPPAVVFRNQPINNVDYGTHFYQAAAVGEFLQDYGRAWGYEPYFLAGYPLGTVYDIDNKAVELWVSALSFLGMPLAFNLFIAVVFLSLPWVLHQAAGYLGLSSGARAVVGFLTLALWYLDPSVRWTWQGGILAFVTASALAVLVVAAFLRYLESGGKRPFITATIAAGLAFLVHASVFFILVVPLAVGLGLYWRQLTSQRWRTIGLFAAVILLLNVYWLVPAFQFAYIKTNSSQFLQGGLPALWDDLLGRGLTQGTVYRRLFVVRFTVLALAIGGLRVWWRARQRRWFWVFVSAIGGLLSLGYLGVYLPGGGNLQPYRFVIPALLLATLPAARVVPPLKNQWRRATGRRRVWGGALALGVALLWVTAVVYFRPRAGDRLTGPAAAYQEVFTWIADNTTAQARVLVDDWRLGTLIPYYTGREVIGGPFFWMWIKHGYANAGLRGEMFGRPVVSYTPEHLRRMLVGYNVGWIITNPRFTPGWYSLDDFYAERAAPFTRIGEVAGFNVYRVDVGPGYFFQGRGRVTAGRNWIRVEDAAAGPIVLKYHWLETLRTDPPLRLERFDALGDPVGFVKVYNESVREFTIYNGY